MAVTNFDLAEDTMNRLLALLLACSATAVADTVSTPQCALEWNPVVDARLVSYRVYVDGVAVANPSGPVIPCSNAKIPKDREVSVYVTAVGADPKIESKPSNTLKVLWSVIEPVAAPGNLRIRVEVAQ